jgi:hypothetical protein
MDWNLMDAARHNERGWLAWARNHWQSPNRTLVRDVVALTLKHPGAQLYIVHAGTRLQATTTQPTLGRAWRKVGPYPSTIQLGKLAAEVEYVASELRDVLARRRAGSASL